MNALSIRPATAGDLEAIDAIYNPYVLHDTCTYQVEVETAADRRAWFERHGPRHPVLVAETGGEVVAWAALAPFRAREAYAYTVEDSVYVRRDRLRRGIGGALLAELIARATALGHHTMIAGIDAQQAASVALHAKHGFVEVARLREVGFKFGRWLDVVYLQRMLAG